MPQTQQGQPVLKAQRRLIEQAKIQTVFDLGLDAPDAPLEWKPQLPKLGDIANPVDAPVNAPPQENAVEAAEASQSLRAMHRRAALAALYRAWLKDAANKTAMRGAMIYHEVMAETGIDKVSHPEVRLKELVDEKHAIKTDESRKSAKYRRPCALYVLSESGVAFCKKEAEADPRFIQLRCPSPTRRALIDLKKAFTLLETGRHINGGRMVFSPEDEALIARAWNEVSCGELL